MLLSAQNTRMNSNKYLKLLISIGFLIYIVYRYINPYIKELDDDGNCNCGFCTPLDWEKMKKIVGQAWWTVMPDGSTLISALKPVENDDVAIFSDPEGNIYTVSLWDDLVKHFEPNRNNQHEFSWK